MRRNPEPFYWLNNPAWYRMTEDGCEMTEEAPKEAVETFEKWKKAWGIKDRPRRERNEG